MTQRLLSREFDEWTGELVEWYEDEETDSLIQKKTLDESKILDATKTEANANPTFNKDTKFHKMASIPPMVMVELMKKGIDVYSQDPAMKKKLYQEIELNYPYLKTHQKKLWRPR